MPVRFSTLVDADVESDGAAFDFSDADDVDIVSSTASLKEESCPPSHSPEAQRADRAEDVLASCALWVFKDRRRKRDRGMFPALPGI